MIVADVFIGVVQNGKLHLDWRKQFDAYLSQFEGHEVEVSVRKRKSKRSLKQSAFLHAAIKPWADELGYTVEELKLALLGECFGYHTVRGVSMPVKLHTSQLNTQEFCDLTELMMQKAAEDGVLILAPDEFRAANKKAAKRAA